jgi:hypothetical protein
MKLSRLQRTQTSDPRRELAHRVNDGLEVQLLWHPSDDRVDVVVGDHRSGVIFELPVAHDRALDAFNHPFAYAV